MDDSEAIRMCRDGDANAFRHLVQRYQQRALGHARALTGSDADAADAAQDAFVDAFRDLDRFDARQDFYPWLYVLLRHRCIKQRTRRATRHESGALPERSAAAGLAPEQVLDVRAALERLDPDDRELIVLKHLDGWTYDEIASRLHVPRGTVMSRLFTARRRLHHQMGGVQR